MNNRTSIALTIATYDRLHSFKKQLEKIIRKKLDYDKTISIILCARPLEDQLVDLIVEAEALYPSKKKTKKEESNHE